MEKLQLIFGAIVPTFFTTEGGVSISEVARRQAEAKQENDAFWSKMADAVAGVFRKIVSFVGAGSGTPQTVDGTTITADEIGAYVGVAERNAATAVLMHGVKLFKRLQEALQVMDLNLYVTDALPAEPAKPELPVAPSAPKRAALGTTCSTEEFMELGNVDEMIAKLNPEVLAKFDFAFWRTANGLNARAAALGKLLSEQGSFFRKLVAQLPSGSEQLTQTGVVITRWEKSYTPEQIAELSAKRDALQAEYNDLQKQLNGCKKQVKDAVRAYNLEQERAYQSAYGQYRLAHTAHQETVQQLQANYLAARQQFALETEQLRASAETFRQQALQEIATLRVRTE